MTARDENEVSDGSSSPSQKLNTSEAPIILASEWFAMGSRVPYDPLKKRILTKESTETVYVWERVVAPFEVTSSSRWMTLLPSVPDGTYAYSKVDGLLQTAPRLYVEFVGLGDSDTPRKYPHGVHDRANLVEAQWRAHGIRRTVLICQSCSSMVMMELLNRQRERLSHGLPVRTRIEHVLCLNGAYFAHTHTPHPLNSSPIVRNTVGKATMKVAQHSSALVDSIVRGEFFPKNSPVTKDELREIAVVARNRNGLNFFSGSASLYVEDHKAHAKRWDLVSVYNMTRRQGITFTIVAGDQDRFERKSYDLAKEKLNGRPDMYFETLPGGYHLPLEHPHRVADMIDGVAMAPTLIEDEHFAWGASYSSLEPKKSRSTRSLSSSYSAGDSTATLVSNTTATSSSTSFVLAVEEGGWAGAEFPEEFEYNI